jgi:hypothetical protein
MPRIPLLRPGRIWMQLPDCTGLGSIPLPTTIP